MIGRRSWWIAIIVNGNRVEMALPGGPPQEGNEALSTRYSFAPELGESSAEVVVGLEHRLGAPCFSSVQLSSRVLLLSKSDEGSIQAAQEKALELNVEFLDNNLPACYDFALQKISELIPDDE